MSRISVVIPCRKNADYIARAIYSCIRQDFLHEVIVVTNGEDISGRDELKKMAADFSIIKAISGVGGSGSDRNFGAKMATGEFLCFLDVNDDLLSGYFASAVHELDKYPQFYGVKVGMQFMNAAYEPLVIPGDPRYMALIASSACNLMLRRSAFEHLGGFPEDERFLGPLGGEDAAFSRAVEDYLKPIGYLPEAFYRVNNLPGSNLEKFLSKTQVIDSTTFGFLEILPEQQADGILGVATDEYLAAVSRRLANRIE